MMQCGLVYNVQRYSVHDGPGIRTTVFLKGCPLRCIWCHNPEGIAAKPQIMASAGKCFGCELCGATCPQRKTKAVQKALPAGHWRCRACGNCVKVCPTECRQLVGQTMSASEVVELALRDRLFYDESHGGVTFSGGEPLAQPEFLLELLRLSRSRGLHTAVDTCGLAPRNKLLAIARLTDLFLFDLKLMNDARHRRFTGVSNRRILENLQALSQVHSRIWLRMPIIPGINDAPSELAAAARFVSQLPGIAQVNLLPYHKIGTSKLERLGRDGLIKDLRPPREEELTRAVALFRQTGLNTIIAG